MSQLTNADIARLRTRDLQAEIESTGGFSTDFGLMPPQLIEFVRPTFPQAEKMLASAPCEMAIWSSPGDGTYYSGDGVPVVATGFANRTGTALALGATAGNLAGHAWNKRKAEKMAQKRWMPFVPQGVLTVSNYGFYIDHEDGQYGRAWQDLQKVEWIEPSKIEIRTSHGQDQARLQLVSDWAELIYILWIKVVAKGQHPRKFDWIPPHLQTIPPGSYPEYGMGARSVHGPAARGPEAPPGHTNANLSLTFGLITVFSVFFLIPPLLFGPLAIWQGIEAKKKGNRSRRRILGMALGAIMLAIIFFVLVIALMGALV